MSWLSRRCGRNVGHAAVAGLWGPIGMSLGVRSSDLRPRLDSAFAGSSCVSSRISRSSWNTHELHGGGSGRRAGETSDVDTVLVVASLSLPVLCCLWGWGRTPFLDET